MSDLLAATEAVGEDQPVWWGSADGGEELKLSNGDGHVVLVMFEAKRTGHAAAAGRGSLEVDADAAQDSLFGGHFHEGFVVTVAVKDGFAIKPRQWNMLGAGFEKFAEQEGLARQGLGEFVVGKEIDEFVAEDGDAAGFEADDGYSGFDFRREFVEDLEQERLGAVEHAEVVERAAAAEIDTRDDHSEASGFEDVDGGLGSGWVEVVIECIGPEENGRGV